MQWKGDDDFSFKFLFSLSFSLIIVYIITGIKQFYQDNSYFGFFFISSFLLTANIIKDKLFVCLCLREVNLMLNWIQLFNYWILQRKLSCRSKLQLLAKSFLRAAQEKRHRQSIREILGIQCSIKNSMKLYHLHQ